MLHDGGERWHVRALPWVCVVMAGACTFWLPNAPQVFTAASPSPRVISLTGGQVRLAKSATNHTHTYISPQQSVYRLLGFLVVWVLLCVWIQEMGKLRRVDPHTDSNCTFVCVTLINTATNLRKNYSKSPWSHTLHRLLQVTQCITHVRCALLVKQGSVESG